MVDFERLQQKIGYKFKDVSLLKHALTHKSYNRLHYERLEFVGDAILDYVIALVLYCQYPDVPEGELSKMRSALVNQNVLYEIALKLDLGQYLFIGEGEEQSGGRNKVSILADVLEAIFAAISFDADFLLAKKVITNLYQSHLQLAQQLTAKDYKSQLQEYLQAQNMTVPLYKVIDASGPEHNALFKVECVVRELNIRFVDSGKTKKEASQNAAAKVLQYLQGQGKK